MVQAAFEALLAEGVPTWRRHWLEEHPAKGQKSKGCGEQRGGRSAGKPRRDLTKPLFTGLGTLEAVVPQV